MIVESMMLAGSALLPMEMMSVGDSVSVDTLGYVEITAKNIHRDARSSILYISNNIRKKYMDALQLLKEFPEVRYNPINGQVSVNGLQNIAYQIDGVDKALEEVKVLPMDAVQNVEIIHLVEGKYVSEGVRYVVNFQLKKTYIGFDFVAQNLLAVSPNKRNGNDAVACEQPKATVMYRNQRWNLNATAVYGRFDWNYPVMLEKTYEGKKLQSSVATPRHPNQLTSRNEFAYRLAADYMFAEDKTLSLNAFYNPSIHKESSAFHFVLPMGAVSEIEEKNSSEIEEDNLKLNLNYIG